MAAWLGAACYSYAPLAAPTPKPGTFVVLTLTDSGSTALTRLLGPNVVVVRGRFLGTDSGQLLVSVASVDVRQGWPNSWSGETVAIPASRIASLESRQLSKGRSALLAGVGMVGLVAAAAAFTLKPAGGGGVLSGGQHPPQ